ncbi:12097_t:CDS:10 [Entrophospora sp. SA101]|nr:12097_t:CDS:10 [Entrophospora sp. SA101]
MPFGLYYDVVVTLARWSIYGFYREIRVIGEENVPKEGPLIVCSTHCNMIVDPAVLASTFPHKRKLHFWAKNSLFGNKYFNVVLHSGGVVPVDRTSKNNKALFASTNEVLKLGEVVAVFPEGTSHSKSRLLELKDGASWAALQYASEYVANYSKIDQGVNSKNDHLKKSNNTTNNKKSIQQVIISPCAITYLQKSKYRSLVIVTYGPPIYVEAYLKDFSGGERAAVKQLTNRIEVELEKLSINAADWDILNSANMARKLLFADDKRVHLEEYAALQYASEYVANYSKIDQGVNSKNDHLKKSNNTTNNKKSIQQVIISPCAITYLQKSKYRSLVIVTYGPPIYVEAYLKDFSGGERAAVKQLTNRIEVELEKLSINAADWDILNSANMARKLLFADDKRVHLEEYVKITQHLIYFFTNTTSEEAVLLKKSLNDYKTKLDMLSLSNSDIARYETRSLTIPWALYQFLFELSRFLIQLPFFLPGLCFHWPIYLMGKISAKYEIYEESRAQNKIILGLAWLILSYSALFFCIWFFFFYTLLGLIFAAGSVFTFAWYHIALVDSNKGNPNRDEVEKLVTKRHSCIDQLKSITREYRAKSDDLRIVLEYCERDYDQYYSISM